VVNGVNWIFLQVASESNYSSNTSKEFVASRTLPVDGYYSTHRRLFHQYLSMGIPVHENRPGERDRA
jgi:hypothetical protein